jgi:hypothetical protein
VALLLSPGALRRVIEAAKVAAITNNANPRKKVERIMLFFC